jgi:uncharacterized protein YcnI
MFDEWVVIPCDGKPTLKVRVEIEEGFVPDTRLAYKGGTVHEQTAADLGRQVTQYILDNARG